MSWLRKQWSRKHCECDAHGTHKLPEWRVYGDQDSVRTGVTAQEVCDRWSFVISNFASLVGLVLIGKMPLFSDFLWELCGWIVKVLKVFLQPFGQIEKEIQNILKVEGDDSWGWLYCRLLDLWGGTLCVSACYSIISQCVGFSWNFKEEAKMAVARAFSVF